MTTKGVEESKSGNMPEAKGQKPPEAEVKPPEGASKVSPEPPKLYTQANVDALVHVAKSEAGREKKTLETERDDLTRQVQTKGNELEDIAEAKKKLEEQIDDLSSGDSDKTNFVKKLRDLMGQEQSLKAEKRDLEADKQTHGERIKKAESLETEVLILGIAEDYENAETAKLSAICSILSAASEEKIRKVAETLWTKKSKPDDPSIVTYSGLTDGGGDNIGSLSPRERVKEADRRLRMK